ncbi:DUF3616 domain-containing protein [Thiomicrorhabdus sp. Kp2]|uniref:DUF3616 domain-containing protein n=1 Tax=Thiomicrorhabdus sp. Kp2 TaxID=1123518 RepID=UPI000417D75E|nr:DUF3616 domain-containing protein [Thiomicrorhabdus sp. Kp2]
MRLLFLLLSTYILLFSANGYAVQQIAKPINQAWLISQNLQVDNLNISGIALPYGFMALATDEGNQLQILKPAVKNHWQNHSTITLSNTPDELDIEALAWQEPYLYALGSHSAKRKKIKSNKTQKENVKRLTQTSPEPARQQLFRIELKSNAQPKSIQILSLQKFIENDPILKAFSGIPSKENGIDLEGLAIDQKARLLIGFRGPVLRGNIVPIMRIKLAKNAFKVKESKTIFIETSGTGVRGIAEIPNSNQFLVLTGAMGDQPLPYQVALWDGDNAIPGADANPSIKLLCDLPVSKGKAEGVQFIKQTKEKIEFLVVFDGLENGQPTAFECSK